MPVIFCSDCEEMASRDALRTWKTWIGITMAFVMLGTGLSWKGKEISATEWDRDTQGQMASDHQQEENRAGSEETPALPEEDVAQWKTYVNEAYGYALEYPGGWKVIEAKPRVEDNKAVWGANILFEGELQKVTFLESEHAHWQGEFQVRVLSNPDDIELEHWIRMHEPQDVTGGSLIQGISDTRIGGHPAKRLSIFGFDHEGIDIVARHEGHIYYVTFTGRNPNDDQLERHLQIYDHMLSSFKFTM